MKRFYVVQVFAGYEDQVKSDLERRIAQCGCEAFFGEVLIPSAKSKQMFDAAGEATDEQLFPGYVLVEMELAPEAVRLVLEVPRVNRFLGGKSPLPLSKVEVERVRAQMSGHVRLSSDRHGFEVGKEVEISTGPFAGFVGVINRVDDDARKLSVMVSIFGRMTPVELGFDQVKQ